MRKYCVVQLRRGIEYEQGPEACIGVRTREFSALMTKKAARRARLRLSADHFTEDWLQCCVSATRFDNTHICVLCWKLFLSCIEAICRIFCKPPKSPWVRNIHHMWQSLAFGRPRTVALEWNGKPMALDQTQRCHERDRTTCNPEKTANKDLVHVVKAWRSRRQTVNVCKRVEGGYHLGDSSTAYGTGNHSRSR